MKKWALLLAVGFVVFSGCDNEPVLSPAEQLAIDIQLIDQYVLDNNLSGFYTDGDVFISFDDEGTGTATPEYSSTVEVVYRGTFLDGEEFDSSKGLSTEFAVYQVIAGWQDALTHFKKGASGTVIIPSKHAYGPRGRGSIPGDAVLIFELELLDFRN